MFTVAAAWYITEHDPASGHPVMIKVAPTVTLTRVTIWVGATATGARRRPPPASTPASDRAEAGVVGAFTAEAYEAFMQDWELRPAHYLDHGSMLRGGHGWRALVPIRASRAGRTGVRSVANRPDDVRRRPPDPPGGRRRLVPSGSATELERVDGDALVPHADPDVVVVDRGPGGLLDGAVSAFLGAEQRLAHAIDG